MAGINPVGQKASISQLKPETANQIRAQIPAHAPHEAGSLRNKVISLLETPIAIHLHDLTISVAQALVERM